MFIDALSSNQQLPILPVRLQTSTFGVCELNYCVRYGYRWILAAIVTEFSFLEATFVPSKLLRRVFP